MLGAFSDGRIGVPSSGPVPVSRQAADLEAINGASGESL
jgi:hypothetical protein